MKYCFFTPSYRGDLDRVVMLRKSIRYFSQEKLQHYILVPKEDLELFRSNLSDDDAVILLKQNDFINPEFYPNRLYTLIKDILPSSQSWRFNQYAGRPGWILQQVIKLGIPDILTDEDAALVLDSDVFFIKPFSISDLVDTSEETRTMVRLHPELESAMHRKHMVKSREILGLPPGETDFHYMSWPFIYYKDWGRSLLEYLEQTHRKPWQKVLFETSWFSEYCTYGVYVEEVLKPKELKINSEPFFTGIWSMQDFDNFISGKLAFNEKAVCIVIQSNLSIPIEHYNEYLEKYLNNA